MFPVSSVFAFFELSSVETCARQTVSLKTTRTDVDCILNKTWLTQLVLLKLYKLLSTHAGFVAK